MTVFAGHVLEKRLFLVKAHEIDGEGFLRKPFHQLRWIERDVATFHEISQNGAEHFQVVVDRRVGFDTRNRLQMRDEAVDIFRRHLVEVLATEKGRNHLLQTISPDP